jgi:hypothetical protein
MSSMLASEFFKASNIPATVLVKFTGGATILRSISTARPSGAGASATAVLVFAILRSPLLSEVGQVDDSVCAFDG